MSTIIAGGFDVQADAEAAFERLKAEGISTENICRFRVNPAGEHHALAAGGDHDTSEGAKHAHGGAVKGAAIGAAVGAAAGAAISPIAGPIGIAAGAGVGAYTGSLVGGLKEIDNEPQPDHGDVRPAETLVAVNLDGTGLGEEAIVRIFESCGATQVERAQGSWVDGEWADFDPTSAPRLIGGQDLVSHGAQSRPTA